MPRRPGAPQLLLPAVAATTAVAPEVEADEAGEYDEDEDADAEALAEDAEDGEGAVAGAGAVRSAAARGGGSTIVVRVAQGAAAAGVAGAVYVQLSGRGKRSREDEQARMLRQISSAVGTSVDVAGPDDALAPPPPPPAAAPAPEAAAPAAAPPPVAPPPPAPPPPPPPPPRRLFQSKSSGGAASVAQLTKGDSDEAALCKTLVWAMRAPVILAEPADASEEALATEAVENLQDAVDDATDSGLGKDVLARCATQVGTAVLIELVDEATKVLDKKAKLQPAAEALCRFLRNANSAAATLGVLDDVGEVLYEGAAPRRKLERVYSSCLELAAPELLESLMGMMGDEGGEDGAPPPPPPPDKVGVVSMDTVEALRPLLKIRESKGQRIMQDVMQKLMMEQMGGKEGGGPDGAPGPEQIEQAVKMVEELLDSGAIGPEDYGSLKEMLTQQIGMPVEELLKRKDELRREAPEFAAIIRILERLEGQTPSAPPAAGGGAGAAAAPAAAAPPAVEDTSGMTMQVKKLDAPVEGGAGATNVKVSIKPKAPAADAPAPAPAPPPPPPPPAPPAPEPPAPPAAPEASAPPPPPPEAPPPPPDEDEPMVNPFL